MFAAVHTKVFFLWTFIKHRYVYMYMKWNDCSYKS